MTNFIPHCPECRGVVELLTFDAAGQHWRCTSCGMTDMGYQYRCSTHTTPSDPLGEIGAPFDEPIGGVVTERHKMNTCPFIDIYQDGTSRTDSPKSRDDAVTNYCFGLVGEIGEVVDSIKKQRYQGHSNEETREKIIDELGDVMWYVCRLATAYDIYMSDVLGHNVQKLQKRYPNGFSVKDSVERKGE